MAHQFTLFLLLLASTALIQGQSHDHDHDADDDHDHSAENFKIVTVEVEPFYYPAGRDGSPARGYVVDLLEKLREKLGRFTYTLVEVRDGKFGSPTGPNNRWTGLIGDVKEGYANFALAPLTKTNDRAAVVDFTVPFMTVKLAALYKPITRSVTSPIRTTTSNPSANDDDDDDDDNDVSFEDLANDPSYKFITIRGGSTDQKIQASNNPSVVKVARWMTSNQNIAYVSSSEEAKRLVNTGGYVFILEGSTAEYLAHQEPCELKEVEVPDSPEVEYAIAFPKRDEHVAHFNDALNELKEDGDLEHLHHEWFHKACDSHEHGHHDDSDHDHDHDHDDKPGGKASTITTSLLLLAAMCMLIVLY